MSPPRLLHKAAGNEPTVTHRKPTWMHGISSELRLREVQHPLELRLCPGDVHSTPILSPECPKPRGSDKNILNLNLMPMSGLRAHRHQCDRLSHLQVAVELSRYPALILG